ncbi:MAG: hypothetical protein ACFCAD_22045, partial [Pleurocapsa sp.]
SETTFDVSIGNVYDLGGIDLSSDLGLPALGLNIDGDAKLSFDYGLDLSFGINKDFGFFLNTEKTELTTGVDLVLNDDFNANASMGLLQLDLANDGDNPTQARIEFGVELEDLDNLPTIEFDDSNNNNKLDDGEEFDFVRLKDDGTYEIIEDFSQYPELAELNDLEEFEDLESAINLDSAYNTENANNDQKRLVPKNDEQRLTVSELKQDFESEDVYIPVLDGSLSVGFSAETSIEGTDTFLPNFLFDLGIGWDAFGYDENGEFQELAQPNINFNNVEVDLGTFISDFAEPIISDIADILEPLQPVIDVLNTDTKLFTQLGINNLFGVRLDANNNGEVSLLELVAALPNSRVSTGFVDAVDKIFDLNELIASTDTESIILSLGSFDLGGFDATDADGDASTVTPQAKGNVADVNNDIDSLPSNGNRGKQKQIAQGFTKDAAIDISLITNPFTAIELLLGKPDVPLFSYNVPELEVGLSLSQNIPIFPPFSALLQGDIDIAADLTFGFDTLGLNQWKALDFAPEESYRTFEGFYISDRTNADGTGTDVPEITIDASFAIGGGIDLVALSGYITGGIKGSIEVDLVDVGENNNTSDGRVRATEITSRLDTPWELFDIAGRVEAFLGAEVQAFRETVYSNHFATFPLISFNLGASGASVGVGADGYIAGGTVFIDANFNKVRDANEPFTVTNVDGTYELDIPAFEFDVDNNNQIDPQEGQIVVIDGVDISTEMPITTPLIVIPETITIGGESTDPNKAYASPLTTLIAELMQPDFAAVQNKLETTLGFSTDVDLLNYDPLKAITLGDSNGFPIFAQQAILQNLVFQSIQ